MVVRSRLGTALTVALVIGAMVACGGTGERSASTETSGTCAAPSMLTAAELAAPVTDFDADVAPVLVKACAFASCHGSRGTANHGVFLAARGSADEAAAVKAALLAPSRALPSMPYVTPGAPEQSFVMHKLDGTLCGLDEQCVGASCGNSMPVGNALLPVSSRDAIRRWIAQGAK